MKELSIEEKAKRYDKAIEVAQRFYNNSVAITKKGLEDIFPELAESEDEKIRKNIISWLKNIESQTIPINEYNSAIAWLEKQGEQKPNTDFSDLRTWKYIVDAVWTEKEGIGQYLDSPFTEEVAKKLQKRFGNIEQKHAWSEEDEKMLNQIISIIENADDDLIRTENISIYTNWLKSRVQPQLKWKPSELQIEALESATENCAYSEYQDCLRELIGQLKKLRDE